MALSEHKWNPCGMCKKHIVLEPCWAGCEKLKEWNTYILDKYVNVPDEDDISPEEEDAQ